MVYSSAGDYFDVEMEEDTWQTLFPRWTIKSQGGSSSTYKIEFNKYSLWVAAAVNMGVLKISDLTSLTETSLSFDDDYDDDDYTFGDDFTFDDDFYLYDDDYFDDDDAFRRRISESPESSSHEDLKFKPGWAASRKNKNRNKQEVKPRASHERAEKAERDENNFGHIGRLGRRLGNHGADKTLGENFEYSRGTTKFVLRKFYDKMDPITCTYNTTRQTQYKAEGGR